MAVTERISSILNAAEENPRTTRIAVYLVLGVFFIGVVPLVFPENQINIFSRMFIWGMFAMGYDFMYGYSGMVSFGHAALFGLGSYAFAMPIMHWGPQNVYLLLFLSVLVASVYAFVVGVIAIRTREVYFAILTLAFMQVTNILIINFTDITGGFNGIVFQLPDFEVIPGVVTWDLYDPRTFYILAVVTVAATYFVLRRLTNSPMGEVLRGVRENVDRLEYIGLDERRYRIAAFTISGAVSGLAGGLYAADLSFVGPEIISAVASGEVIVWTILGGKGTLIGPLFGGAAIYYIEDTVSTIITWWLIPVGLLFITMVIVMPEGVAGRVKDVIKRLREADSE